jgi:hypothetical protein
MNITMSGAPAEWKRRSRRAYCPHCHSSQWTADGQMQRDHDRPDGKQCRLGTELRRVMAIPYPDAFRRPKP